MDWPGAPLAYLEAITGYRWKIERSFVHAGPTHSHAPIFRQNRMHLWLVITSLFSTYLIYETDRRHIFFENLLAIVAGSIGSPRLPLDVSSLLIRCVLNFFLSQLCDLRCRWRFKS